MPDMLPFRAFPLLANPHAQTIMAAKLGWPLAPRSVTTLVPLPDGDRLAVEISTPAGWQAQAPTVVMLHGLCGCHRSPYMIRMAAKLWRRGVRAVRVNMRGCGSGEGLARRPYHSGRSDDVLAVLNALHLATPQSTTTLIGFSLGGNQALKLAGELQANAVPLLHQVIAVCPPVDLAACVRLLGSAANRLYERHFVHLLKQAVRSRQSYFPELPRVAWPKAMNLYAFDQAYTAPQCGFRDADDYYARCSAAPLVPRITIPCRILFAADDPFIDARVFDQTPLPQHIQVVCTDHGGHLGFLGIPGGPGGYHWMDTQLLAWLGCAPEQRLHSQSTRPRMRLRASDK